MITPLGDLTVFEDGGKIVAATWGRAAPDRSGRKSPVLDKARKQLEEYFEGKRKRFDLPLHASGTDFQRKVWEAIARIPFGATASYGDLAHELDSGPRAIGGACGKNPIAVIVPCHRVLASHGAIGGYSGGEGLATKRGLLALETPHK